MGRRFKHIYPKKRKVQWVMLKLIYVILRLFFHVGLRPLMWGELVRQGWRCNHVLCTHIFTHMKNTPHKHEKNNISSSHLQKKNKAEILRGRREMAPRKGSTNMTSKSFQYLVLFSETSAALFQWLWESRPIQCSLHVWNNITCT